MLKIRTHQHQNGQQHKQFQPSKYIGVPRFRYSVQQRWRKVLVPLVLGLLGLLLLLPLYGLLGGRWTATIDQAPEYASHLRDCASGSEEELLKSSYLPPEIPKIIHQTSKSRTDLPPLWQRNQATWITHHPHWKYNLWLDADNMKLVEEHFHWFAPTYKSFKNPIMRVDAARYMYMYAYGGVYVDMDVENLKPLEPLLQGHQAVLASMGTDLSFSDSLPNAFLASVPRHPFWLYVLLEIQERASSWLSGRGNWLKVEEATGPAMLKAVLDREYPQLGCSYRANKSHSIFILGPKAIFPFDWHDLASPVRQYCLVEYADTFDPDKCKAAFPDSYAVSYWSHSWVPNVRQ